MSSSNHMSQKATLFVDAGEQQTEIEILDGNMIPVPLAENLGRVEIKLEPGVYAVRFRTGNQVKQKLAILQSPGASETVSLEQDELMFSTAAPIRKTTTSREYHREPAERISWSKPYPIAVPDAPPDDSNLLVFARDLGGKNLLNPAQDLTLHKLDGTLLGDLSQLCEHNLEQKWAGCHLRLPPGGYLLRNEWKSSKWTEMLLQTCPGWQTQAFLQATTRGRDGEESHIDLSRTSVLMAPADQGFDPERMDYRWTEQALLALSGGRVVPGTVSTEMLWLKFENPMLGIYAAHLQLGQKKINSNLMKKVFLNLLDLVGPIPDVLSVGWALVLKVQDDPDLEAVHRVLRENGVIEAPPMLQASWQWLVRASVIENDLIPEKSLAGTVSGLDSTEGPWLVQLKVGAVKEQKPKENRLFKIVNGFARKYFKRDLAGIAEKMSEFADKMVEKGAGYLMDRLIKFFEAHPNDTVYLYSKRYTSLERQIAIYIYPLADQFIRPMAEKMPDIKQRIREESIARSKKPEVIIAALNIPLSTALKTMSSLIQKLESLPVLPHQNLLKEFVGKESRGNEVLKSILQNLNDHETSMYHRRSGIKISYIQLLYLRYRNSPSTGLQAPSPGDLAQTLTDNEFVDESDDSAISGKLISKFMKQIRRNIIADLSNAVRENALKVDRRWIGNSLPNPKKYKKGELFPALETENVIDLPAPA